MRRFFRSLLGKYARANEDAQKEINEYIEWGLPYEGIASIPDGAIEDERVLVTLKWDLNP